MAEEKRPTKRYARVSHPLIEAVVHGLFRFQSRDDANKKLREVRKTYHASRQQPEYDASIGPRLRLWIADFDVTDEDKEKGYCGHFAVLRIEENEDGRLVLIAEKENSSVTTHPRKKYPHHQQVNWSHPIMINIKRQKRFDTLEDAQRMLQNLHEEYPNTTVPGVGRMNAIVYEREEGNKGRPVKKYVFTIEAHKDGGFYVQAELNSRGIMADNKPAQESVGSFSAKVQAQRAKKPKPRA